MKATGRGKKHPPPDLYQDLFFVWEGFTALALTRPQGSAIQFSEIESHLNLTQIWNPDTRQEFAHLIRVMDSEYIAFFKEKNKNVKNKITK